MINIRLHVLKLLRHNDAARQQCDNCTSTANTVRAHTHTHVTLRIVFVCYRMFRK
jgi:hypothetical protein